MNDKLELLSPAGDMERLEMALCYGADAVYLGAKNFNARRNAENFDDFALPETVKFCHERGTKVFVTVNTLVTDGEMDALIEEADAIAETGAERLVMGFPRNMDGTEGPRASLYRDFAALLEQITGMKPILWDERRTTIEAHQILSENNYHGKKRKNAVDAVAASLILEGYLAYLRNHKE